MQHRIAISNLSNSCRYFGTYADAGLFDHELNRVMRQQLPAAIGAEVERQLGSLTSGSGIFRIRRLKLRLNLLRRDFTLNGLANQLASELVAALAAELSSNTGNVRVYDGETDYMAELISDLLAGRAWHTWEYLEFEALRHLDTTEAVVQLLLPRQAMLPGILPTLKNRQRLRPLLESIDRDQSTRLFLQWTGHEPALLFDQSSLPQLNLLEDQLELFEPVVPGHDRPDQPLEIRALQELFQAIARGQELQADNALWVVLHYCFLLRHPELQQQLQHQQPGDGSAIEIRGHPDRMAPDYTMQLCGWLKADPRRGLYLNRLLDKTRSSRVPGVAAESGYLRSTDGTQAIISPRTVSSQYAGLMLLFPVIIGFELQHCFRPARLKEALAIALFGEADLGPLAWLEDLLPDDDLPATGSLPDNWRLGLAAEIQSEIEALDGTRRLAHFMLSQFAARLGGLQLSSADYLRSQFLKHPGSIEFGDTTVAVTLEPVPLCIVLQMSGLHDWTGPMSWIGRELKIGIRP